jgi:hypothetical protein
VPYFEQKDKSGVFLESCMPVFKRGRRLDKETIRRIRDIFYSVMLSLGCDPEDCASIGRSGVTARQIRNRIDRDMPVDIRAALTKVAEEIVADVQARIPCARPRAKRFRPNTSGDYRQLLLFGDDDAQG